MMWIALAHELWQRLVQPHDVVIDATCGNGHDTVALARLVPQGKVYALDIQETAIHKSRERLTQENLLTQVDLRCQSHATFPQEIAPHSVRLIVYNLGYLPGGDKKLTTETATTLQSVHQALPLLQAGGALSLTLYPGHPEGLKEQEALLDYAKKLPPDQWMVCHTQWLNRLASPSLLMIFHSSKL